MNRHDRRSFKHMERSKRYVPDLGKMISDYDSLERNLRDLRNVLAVIAYQQEDHVLSVPFAALAAMPAGCELEVSVDRVHGNYNFSVIVPTDAVPSGNSPAPSQG